MEHSGPALLAGGHEKHFTFLPGGELVAKKSGLREACFYVWLYRLAGKPLLHATSIESFLKELHSGKGFAAASISHPGGTSAPLEGPAPFQSNLCKVGGHVTVNEEDEVHCVLRNEGKECVGETGGIRAFDGESSDEHRQSQLYHTSEGKESKADSVFQGTLRPQTKCTLNDRNEEETDISRASRSTSELVDGAEREVLVADIGGRRAEEVCGGQLLPRLSPHALAGENPTRHPHTLLPTDGALWSTLLVPGSSSTTDNFIEFSREYCRQARAILPWLPLCFGTVEHVTTSPFSSSIDQPIPQERSCQGAMTAVQSGWMGTVSARPKREVVLENLLHGMRKPAVLDTKVGTRYYGEQVSAVKREKEARYARERGTHEVGLAFCGYCCGSTSERNTVYVSGGSRAPPDFKHPKTLEAFSELFQAFLMLQGDVDAAICLGRMFSRSMSELILLLRAAQEKPFANFFASSILLIYDAERQGVANVGGGQQPAGDGSFPEDVNQVMRTEWDVMNSACNEKDEATGMKAVKCAEKAPPTSYEGKKQTAVERAQEVLGPIHSGTTLCMRQRERCQSTKDGSEGTPDTRCHQAAEDAIASRGVISHPYGVSYVSSDITAEDPARKAGKLTGVESNCSQEDVSDLRHVGPATLNAKVRIVDFAHVVVLPREVEEGFIFGLQNFRAALDLATSCLENSKRCTLNASH